MIFNFREAVDNSMSCIYGEIPAKEVAKKTNVFLEEDELAVYTEQGEDGVYWKVIHDTGDKDHALVFIITRDHQLKLYHGECIITDYFIYDIISNVCKNKFDPLEDLFNEYDRESFPNDTFNEFLSVSTTTDDENCREVPVINFYFESDDDNDLFMFGIFPKTGKVII
jgi:thiamine biosynthesis protein ThiC